MEYFIADTHFGHEATVTRFGRPFKTVDEMDRHIISNWQSVVNQDDTVYMLGDFCYRSRFRDIDWYLKQLPGKITILLGNHDKAITPADQHFFEQIEFYIETLVDNERVHMCHYAMLDWKQYMKGSLFVHGHTHSTEYLSKKGFIYDTMRQIPTLLNAAVEINNYMPVTLRQLKVNNEIFYNRKWKNGTL